MKIIKIFSVGWRVINNLERFVSLIFTAIKRLKSCRLVVRLPKKQTWAECNYCEWNFVSKIQNIKISRSKIKIPANLVTELWFTYWSTRIDFDLVRPLRDHKDSLLINTKEEQAHQFFTLLKTNEEGEPNWFSCWGHKNNQILGYWIKPWDIT